MAAIDWACDECAQQPGEACINPDGSPFIYEGQPAFHPKRVLEAESQAVRGANISIEELHKAVDSSGLI